MRISVLFLLLVISSLPLGSASAADQWPTLTVSLRISVDGRSIEGQRELTSGKYRTQAEFDKAFDRNVIPLKVDHSAQLKVEMIDPLTTHPLATLRTRTNDPSRRIFFAPLE